MVVMSVVHCDIMFHYCTVIDPFVDRNRIDESYGMRSLTNEDFKKIGC